MRFLRHPHADYGILSAMDKQTSSNMVIAQSGGPSMVLNRSRSVPDEFSAAKGPDVKKAFLDYERTIVGLLPPCVVF